MLRFMFAYLYSASNSIVFSDTVPSEFPYEIITARTFEQKISKFSWVVNIDIEIKLNHASIHAVCLFLKIRNMAVSFEFVLCLTPAGTSTPVPGSNLQEELSDSTTTSPL